MLRAYRNWDFPKGVVEPGEDPLAAARREVREETLIEDLHFNWGDVYRETAPYSNNKVARYYIAETHTETITLPVSPELGRPEHDEWRWVNVEEALSLASPRIDPIVRWAAEIIGIPGTR
jgi:8-oxo-dGTP pyrophosphatase MutT (NUDIX family)